MNSFTHFCLTVACIGLLALLAVAIVFEYREFKYHRKRKPAPSAKPVNLFWATRKWVTWLSYGFYTALLLVVFGGCTMLCLVTPAM